MERPRLGALGQRAADFANGIGREKLISISHSVDQNQGVVTVWYWDGAATMPASRNAPATPAVSETRGR